MDSNELKSQITAAIGAHGMWKTRLKNAVATGTLDVSAQTVKADDNCKFGKWLQDVATDPAVCGSAHYSEVKSLHTAFHRCAGRVAEKIEAGDRSGAASELGGPDFDTATIKLVTALTKWKSVA